MRSRNNNDARRAVAVVVQLLETVFDMTESYDPKHVQRMVRCACWLLCALSDAHLTDEEQDNDR